MNQLLEYTPTHHAHALRVYSLLKKKINTPKRKKNFAGAADGTQNSIHPGQPDSTNESDTELHTQTKYPKRKDFAGAEDGTQNPTHFGQKIQKNKISSYSSKSPTTRATGRHSTPGAAPIPPCN